jgi:hypothetical protein
MQSKIQLANCFRSFSAKAKILQSIIHDINNKDYVIYKEYLNVQLLNRKCVWTRSFQYIVYTTSKLQIPITSLEH